MPLIRYPMSDIAVWADYSQGRFRLVGREGMGVRVGPNSYDMTNLRSVLASVLDGDEVHGFQVLLRRENSKDEMVFRIAGKPGNSNDTAEALRKAVDTINEQWAEDVREGLINPLVVEWILAQDFHYHARSGKLREIFDLRYQALSEKNKGSKNLSKL